MTHHFLSWFTKPVAFYAYTSHVVSPVLEIDATRFKVFGKGQLTDDEQEIIERIDNVLKRVGRLHRHNDYCSTREDNKTVIEMSDGSHSIFLGRYDWSYFVGLGVRSDCKDCKIDLSDVSTEEWRKTKSL